MIYTLESFYWSKAWRTFLGTLIDERTDKSTGVLYCARCGLPIVGAYQCHGHHKIELTEDNVNDPEIALNPDNVELIHASCHNREHNRWALNRLGVRSGKEVYLVYGAPCSGKTTAVRERATETDLIVDFDALRHAMTGGAKYNTAKYGRSIAFALRNLLIDQIKTRAGVWETAYVIGGYPYFGERERLCDELGATSIFIEATKEECMRRLHLDAERRPYAAEWEGFIDKWFDSYEPDPS